MDEFVEEAKKALGFLAFVNDCIKHVEQKSAPVAPREDELTGSD